MKYTITQASNILNCKPYLLRFYESEFELNIPREQNNRRYYTTKEIDIFRYIEKLKENGKKNKEIKETLHNVKEKDDDNNINKLIDTINLLREEIEDLKQKNDLKQRDELITENARLKI